MYVGQPLFWELDNFLRLKGFKLKYIDLGRWPNVLWLYKILKTGPWVANAVYMKRT